MDQRGDLRHLGSAMPWVVTAGVPMRRPLVMYGGRGSSGTVFSGKKARLALDRAGISLNENTVPDDPRPPVHHERAAHRHPGGHDPGHARARDGAGSPR